MSKYRAIPTVVDRHRFASKFEAMRYSELKLLERAGQIRALTLHPKYPLMVGDELICTYIGDFGYFEKGKAVVEDTKGFATPVYKIKRKLFMVCYPDIEHRETRR